VEIRSKLFYWTQLISQLSYFRPQNHRELFNLRHAQLRNVVERIFGALKWRFPILKYGSEYSPKVQAQLVIAYMLIHNFIHIHDVDDIEPELQQFLHELESDKDTPMGYSNSDGDNEDGAEDEDEGLSSEERENADERRDSIAKEMWEDYVAELCQRGYT
jgi:hypothetical protein